MTTSPTGSAAQADAVTDASTDAELTETGADATGSEVVPVRHPAPSTAGHRDLRLAGEQPIEGPRAVSLLLYSDDVDTRARVQRSIGKRLAADLPPVAWTECATSPAVLTEVGRGGFDVLVLDGEAAPTGGLGLCKQLKDEIFECPPVLVLTGRPQDAWLATWSRADAAVPHPLDPRALAEAIVNLVRLRRSTVVQ